MSVKPFLSILLLMLSVSSVFGVEITYSATKINSFELSYIVDNNSTYNLKKIKNAQFKTIHNRHAITGKVVAIWYKLELNNITDETKEIYLHDSFAYYSKYIQIFEYSKNRFIKQGEYDILAEKQSNKLIGSTLVYKLDIPANTKTTLFIKNEPMITALCDINIYDKKSSQERILGDSFYSTVIVAIMMTLALYNMVLYLFNRRKEFLYYALYMLSPALGLMYKYGIIFSHFQFYGEQAYLFNLTAIIMQGFLILFLKQVLQTQKMAKKINIILNVGLGMILIDFLFGLFVDLTLAMEAFKFMFIFIASTLIYLGYFLIKNSHPLGKLFVGAYGCYAVGMVITILGMSGIIELNFFTFHSGGIGIILEALLFSYLMHFNIKILEKRVFEQREIIISNNKKSQLGDMLSAITHQWKQPLSRMASATTLLEFKLSKNQKIEPKELREKIEYFNNDIHFLSDTIDDFKDLFNPNEAIKEYDLRAIINSAVKMSQENSVTNKIEIMEDLKFDTPIIKTYKNELRHIILNIFENSKEAFKSSDEAIKIIKVFGYNKGDKVYIDIIDNAGGIKKEHLPLIFNENYTSKKEKVGSGLGLYLSKVILEGHLKGSIEATNIIDGAQFRIIL